jgi:hypothetical protein
VVGAAAGKNMRGFSRGFVRLRLGVGSTRTGGLSWAGGPCDVGLYWARRRENVGLLGFCQFLK